MEITAGLCIECLSEVKAESHSTVTSYERANKKKERKNVMFSIYFATKEKLSAPIFHIVKGRNNDFLFGMQFSASLVKC